MLLIGNKVIPDPNETEAEREARPMAWWARLTDAERQELIDKGRGIAEATDYPRSPSQTEDARRQEHRMLWWARLSEEQRQDLTARGHGIEGTGNAVNR
jgi:hypothetical protein